MYRRAIVRATAVITLLLSAACTDQPPEATPGMTGRGGPVSVIAVPVSARRFIDRFSALGTARANESIELTSRISSVITRIHFEEGQSVNIGDLLVELDSREIEATLMMAEAALKQKRSEYRRGRALNETRAVSEAELEQLEAEVQMADAEVRGARARLDNASIRAPFAGTVGLRRVSPGDLVGPDTVITTLDDTGEMKLEFTVPEVFLASVNAGMKIQATSAVYPGREFTGSVSLIDPRVDPVTRSVTVVARLPNPEDMLKPGMFLTVDLENVRDNVLMVPEEALVPRQGRQYVFVIKDGRAMEKQVELGGRVPGLAEIREGLAAGEVVVTEGTQKLRNGSAVSILKTG